MRYKKFFQGANNMVNWLKDRGINREEHKIIYEYLIGQLKAYSPNWIKNKGFLRSFRTRVKKISNLQKIGKETVGEYNRIRFESEGKIKNEIQRLLHCETTPLTLELEYYKLRSRSEHPIEIELEIFPDVWIAELENPKNNLLFTSDTFYRYKEKIKTARKVQSNVVFANENGDDCPYIAGIDVPENQDVWISDESELKYKRIGFNPAELIKPIHAKNPKNRKWRVKPRFAYAKSNFVPCQVSDVYSPDMKKVTSEKFFKFLINEFILNKDHRNNKKISEAIDWILQNINFLNEPKLGKIGESVLEGVSKVMQEEEVEVDINKLRETILKFLKLSAAESEKLKLEVLKVEAEEYGGKNDLFDVFYCDRFQIVNFTIGYFSGKFDSSQLERKERPKLRKFSFLDNTERQSSIELIPENPISLSGKTNWPVFFQPFETEGLLFIAKQKLLDQFKNNLLFEVNHTISHAIMKNVPKFSGIDHGLIREYLFSEECPAFLIYSKEPGDFRTKGLRFLFEKNMDDLFLEVKSTLECPFEIIDYSDRPHEKGCANCTMVPIGCTLMNQKLNRLEALNAFKN